LLGHCRLGCRRLPLRFQKQFRLGENAFPGHARALAPSRVELSGLPCVATVLSEHRRHPLALLRIHARHRHQIFQRHLRRDLALAHLLLDRFRQPLHQSQTPRYPARAAVEAARQFVHRVPEALLHLNQQPALFQRAFLRAEAQRPRQHQGLGFAHRPHCGVDRIPAELLQRGDALVAVNHQVAFVVVWGNNYHDRGLLAAVGQRRQQSALAERLTDSQVFPSPVQLVKLQLHRRLLGIQYAGCRN